MRDEQNTSGDELLRQNEERRENEITEAEEALREKEEIRDDEDNRKAKKISSGNDEEDDDKDDDDSKREDNEQDSGSESSSSGGAGGAGGAAGAAGAASVAVIAVVAAIITTVSGITAAFREIQVFGTYLTYILTVSMEYEETEDQTVDFDNLNTGLVLAVTKNGFSESVELVTGVSGQEYSVEKELIEGTENKYKVSITFSGEIDGLEENTRYKLSVIGDEDGKTVTYTSENVKTTARVSEVRGVNSVCTCDRDGMFNFSVDFSDENGFYTDFNCEFRNTDGETVYSAVIENPSEEQHIPDVDKLPGSEYILVVTFKSSAETDAEADNSETDYGDVTINVNKGVITITARVKI